jgi:imidazoleglycerol phosphate synthase glutamine amidotransferase subunit HisH
MRIIISLCLATVLITACSKERTDKVEIYMLKSFTRTMNTATTPATITYSNAELESSPLVADKNILFYTKSSTTFKLNKNIKPVIIDYAGDKGFAVTVNKKVIYFGQFHPSYYSSIAFGVATIDPILFQDNELKIRYATPTGYASLQQFDKRNDNAILDALQASGRLR